MSAPQSDAFKKAVVDSQKLTSKPSNDDLLELYGTPPPLSRRSPSPHALISPPTALYKVALGESFDAAPKPGMFDLKVRLPLPRQIKTKRG